MPIRNIGLGLVVAAGLLGCGGYALAQDTDNEPVLAVHLAFDEPGAGRRAVEYEGDTLFLAPSPVLADQDFVTARPVIGQDPDGEPTFYLRVRCTDEANERMLGATGEHIDQSAVVLFGGEVRNVAVVKSAVGCQNMTLGWPAGEEEARRMEEKVRGVWPAEG